MPKCFRRTVPVLLLAIVASVLPAAGVRAEDGVDEPQEGPKLAVKYTGCAVGLAIVSSPAGALVAFLACAKMFLDEIK